MKQTDVHPLRALREARGLTREQLAVKAGRSINTIARIEQGAPGITRTSTLRSIAHALGVSIQDILGPGQCADGQDPIEVIARLLGRDPADARVRGYLEVVREELTADVA